MGLRAFTLVVERGAFARAARDMGQSTSSLTRQVDALEEHLGVPLLNRSTRRLTLTDAGQAYYPRAVRLLEDLAEANMAVGEGRLAPKGLLRVSLPVVFAQVHLSAALPDFLKAHPDMRLEVMLSDQAVDLVEQRVDVAVRIGPPGGDSLISRRLACSRRVVCASPAYLAAQGVPDSPADLAHHACCAFAYGHGGRNWHFRRGEEHWSVRVDGRLRANNAVVLRDAALAGCGVALMPVWLVHADLAAGRLVPLLVDWLASPTEDDSAIHALYLPSRRGSPAVRAFIDFLVDRLGAATPWERDQGAGVGMLRDAQH